MEQLSKVQAEVIAAHARLDAMSERIGGIETSIRAMAEDVKSLLAREPSKLPVYALGGILAVMLTILSLVVAPLYSGLGRLEHDYRKHSDGHPEYVKERLKDIDKKHADEHLEQEEDIGELRDEDDQFEDRMDDHNARLSRIEEFNKRVVGVSPEGFHQKDWLQVSVPIYDRIRRLEMVYEEWEKERRE